MCYIWSMDNDAAVAIFLMLVLVYLKLAGMPSKSK